MHMFVFKYDAGVLKETEEPVTFINYFNLLLKKKKTFQNCDYHEAKGPDVVRRDEQPTKPPVGTAVGGNPAGLVRSFRGK